MIKKKLFYVVLFLVIYVVLVVGVIVYDHYLDYKLATFDLNNDTVFSHDEQTLEQQKYQDLVTNDLGRNLIPISGLFVSFVTTLLVFISSKTYSYFYYRIHLPDGKRNGI